MTYSTHGTRDSSAFTQRRTRAHYLQHSRYPQLTRAHMPDVQLLCVISSPRANAQMSCAARQLRSLAMDGVRLVLFVAP